MKILLTNDDGIYAEGIITLARVLKENGHKLVVVSPDRERSASGHSITIHTPLRAKSVKIESTGLHGYKVNGTPADCVKLGLEALAPFSPDLVISGINHGKNLGYDVLYSGTVSAAIEGFMMGFNSLAVSLVIGKGRNFEVAANYISKLISNINFNLLNDKILLNINIPDLPENKIQGSKITRLSHSQYEDTYEERIDPEGKSYYWLTGKLNENDLAEDTDIKAVNDHVISITPLKLELTDFKLQNKLKENIISID